MDAEQTDVAYLLASTNTAKWKVSSLDFSALFCLFFSQENANESSPIRIVSMVFCLSDCHSVRRAFGDGGFFLLASRARLPAWHSLS